MPLSTPLQMLVVYAKGPLSKAQLGRVEAALKDAGKTLGLICNDLHICGVVGLEEDIPLPQGIGYNEDQDYLDTSNTNYDKIGKLRDRFLEASDYKAPKYVLFVTPAGDMANTTNAYSMRGGYCSVVPVPTGVPGTADARTYAHEICHGLGLTHVDDPKNLMYPTRTLDGQLTGTNLTMAQVEQTWAFLKEHPSLQTK